MTNTARFEGAWEEVTLGEIGRTYAGLSGKTSADFGQGNARYVSFLDVLEQATVTWRRFGRVRVSCAESQNRVVSGDVLFNATSETPEDLAMGSMALVDIDELYLNSFCFGFRIADRNRCDPLFLAYCFRGIPGREAMYGLAQGATRYNLSKQRFLRIQITLPPLAEQRAIVGVLSDVDELIESLEALIAKKRAIKQAAMQELLTGKTRLPGFGGEWELATADTRVPERKGYLLGAPVGYQRTDVGVIPDDWRVSSLGSLLAEPPSYGVNAPAVPFDGSRPTYIRITDLGNDGQFKPSPRVSVNGGEGTRFLLRSGDLVFARTGATVGKSYLYDPKDGPLVFAGFLIRVTPDAKRLQTRIHRLLCAESALLGMGRQ